MTKELVAERLRALVERRVSAAEVREAIQQPLSESERESTLALARWFTRRYPTGAERLAYVRQAYARWRTRDSRSGRARPLSREP